MLRADNSTTTSNANQSETFSSAGIMRSAGDLPSLLVVEDDQTVREACQVIAVDLGFEVWTADSIQTAILALQAHAIDIVLLDVRLGPDNGLALLDQLRAEYSNILVIVMTAFASVSSAVVALRAGAIDYIQKPFSIEELTSVLESAAHRPLFEAETERVQGGLRANGLVPLADRSSSMGKIIRIVSRIAFASHPVLIVGEPGTGKEVVARSIHLNGPNASGPFISMSCSSSEGAIAKLLLGTTPYSPITGGYKAHDVDAPSNGTIFLDEIGDLPLGLQARLLCVLEEKRMWADASGRAMSARVFASSTCDLNEMVRAGSFRKDLFLRLNVVNLRLPPLRERKTDIPLICAQILARIAHESKRTYRLGKNAIRPLMEYDWPGNVRELEQAIEYACVVASGAELHLCDFPENIHDYDHLGAVSLLTEHAFDNLVEPDRQDGGLNDVALPMAEIEKNAILNTLRQVDGDKLLAARLLRIGKTTLYRKLKEYECGSDDR
jgi:two-component system response regulator HydG